MGRSYSLILRSTVDQTQDQKAIHLKRKQVEPLGKKKGYLEDILTETSSHPGEAVDLSPSFYTLPLVPIDSEPLTYWKPAPPWHRTSPSGEWASLSHWLAESVQEFGEGHHLCIRPRWISKAANCKLKPDIHLFHWNSDKSNWGPWH